MNATLESATQTHVEHVKVLIVEDDADMRRAIRDVFQMRGFVVNTAHDGQAGLDLALHEHYDVIVTDVRMPGISGIDLTRRILIHRPTSRVVVITAYPEWKVCRDASEAGASCVVTKPITLVKLAETVERLVSRPVDAEPESVAEDYGGEG